MSPLRGSSLTNELGLHICRPFSTSPVASMPGGDKLLPYDGNVSIIEICRSGIHAALERSKGFRPTRAGNIPALQMSRFGRFDDSRPFNTNGDSEFPPTPSGWAVLRMEFEVPGFALLGRG
jgi:hypothetical protein